MLYVNQLDYPYVYYYTNQSAPENDDRRMSGNIARSGCGICSAMMMVDRLFVDRSLSMTEAIQLAYDVHACDKPGTQYSKLAPALAGKFGLRLEMNNDPERLRACLREGGCAVLNSGGDRDGYTGVFTHGGHYIVAISEAEDGRIVVLDPAYSEGKFDEEGRKGKVEVKNGVLCYTDMQVLVDDCSNRNPGFYLFWRA